MRESRLAWLRYKDALLFPSITMIRSVRPLTHFPDWPMVLGRVLDHWSQEEEHGTETS
jgi:hypothetical protein